MLVGKKMELHGLSAAFIFFFFRSEVTAYDEIMDY